MAYFIYPESIGEAPEPEEEQEDGESKKNLAVVALGRLGAKQGGKAQAAKLTAEQRPEIARRAAHARWSKKD